MAVDPDGPCRSSLNTSARTCIPGVASNSPSGTLQICVFSSFTVSLSLPMISCSRCNALGVALPAQDHEIISVGDEASAEAALKPELLPPQHEPAHVEVREQW